MGLGARITKLRMEKRESLQDVADAVQVSKAHIWELEKGRTDNPSMGLVTKLADHFGVSISFLVGEDSARRGCRSQDRPHVQAGHRSLHRRP